MAAYFLDSSALIKRYVQEAGTTWIRDILHPTRQNSIFVSRLASLELVAVLVRQMRTGAIDAAQGASVISEVRSAFAHEFRVIEVTALLASHALNLVQSHALRGADAVHLAAATELERRRASPQLPGIVFVSADYELNQAAQKEGLLIENPNHHP